MLPRPSSLRFRRADYSYRDVDNVAKGMEERSAPTVKKARQPNLPVAASDLSVVLRSSASSLAPSIRRNRGRAGHFLAASRARAVTL